MKYYADVNNYYLAKYLNSKDLEQFTSSWFFYDQPEDFRLAELLHIPGNVFSFLWEYEDGTLLEKIDQWKRVFRRHNIEFPSDMKFRYKNYISSGKKVYLDMVETDYAVANGAFNKYSAFNIARNLTQFIVDETMHLDNVDLHFLEADDPLTRFRNCIKMIDFRWLHAIVLNGYHHRGDMIKVFIHKKESHFLPEINRLEHNVFENTYVGKSLSW
ncbi:hypothetical protein [Chryseobacterium sp. BIGb0232]|uniref:hypothetical protein n=1 Tax=Chryseobacterium sp. BIGb0232 TaxID=2940598 RepID=UPI000F47C3AE|nr:hypothetical protein [Chryseobacterium sp. BIGb0232]MCS4304133.1 hypothetical protein [Chryseobacterium sp. BIGb0232]ROS17712.1 hypothetical protein EDF65_2093 [Chryseobacterium nakagawai]